MNIRPFDHHEPDIDPSAYVDSSAVIIGQVSIGAHSSVWPHVSARGDINSISIGRHCSIQDNSVIHVTHDGPFNPGGYTTRVGDHVTVGHRVVLHGCTIGNLCLIGMDSCLMDGAVVEDHVIIAAGSLVTPGTVCESGYLWLGRPAKKVRALTEREREQIAYSADYYSKLADKY